MTSNDLKRGQVVLVDNAPCLVVETSSQSPSARGGQTLIKTRYRNLLTGQVLDRAFKAGERIFEADFEKRKGQFLYADGDNGMFMDLDNYEQYEIGTEIFGPVKGYLIDGSELVLGMFEGRVVSLEPPMIVELTVADTTPVIKNATAQAQTKEATLETGLTIQVPSYLEPGIKIKVDTREGLYISRV
jgi:elongation factor P